MHCCAWNFMKCSCLWLLQHALLCWRPTAYWVTSVMANTGVLSCPSSQPRDATNSNVMFELILPLYEFSRKPFMKSIFAVHLSHRVSWTFFLEKELSTFSLLHCAQWSKPDLKQTKDLIVALSALCGTGIERSIECCAGLSGQHSKSPMSLSLLKEIILDEENEPLYALRVPRNPLRFTTSRIVMGECYMEPQAEFLLITFLGIVTYVQHRQTQRGRLLTIFI